jgi:hypothetical protein
MPAESKTKVEHLALDIGALLLRAPSLDIHGVGGHENLHNGGHENPR